MKVSLHPRDTALSFSLGHLPIYIVFESEVVHGISFANSGSPIHGKGRSSLERGLTIILASLNGRLSMKMTL